MTVASRAQVLLAHHVVTQRLMNDRVVVKPGHVPKPVALVISQITTPIHPVVIDRAVHLVRLIAQGMNDKVLRAQAEHFWNAALTYHARLCPPQAVRRSTVG